MSNLELINRKIQKLPEPFQKEVLDFIEFLATKTLRQNTRKEDLEWYNLSLNTAMRNLDDDEFPTYCETDFREKWN